MYHARNIPSVPRKVLQINNTCDLIAGEDKLYISSRNRNQFFQLREMLLGIYLVYLNLSDFTGSSWWVGICWNQIQTPLYRYRWRILILPRFSFGSGEWRSGAEFLARIIIIFTSPTPNGNLHVDGWIDGIHFPNICSYLFLSVLKSSYVFSAMLNSFYFHETTLETLRKLKSPHRTPTGGGSPLIFPWLTMPISSWRKNPCRTTCRDWRMLIPLSCCSPWSATCKISGRLEGTNWIEFFPKAKRNDG